MGQKKLVILTHGRGRHLTSNRENITNGWQYLRPRIKLKVRIQFELGWKWQMGPILLGLRSKSRQGQEAMAAKQSS